MACDLGIVFSQAMNAIQNQIKTMRISGVGFIMFTVFSHLETPGSFLQYVLGLSGVSLEYQVQFA